MLAGCVALASSIKSEGIFLLSIFFLLPIPFKKKAFFSLLAAIPFLFWQYVVHTHHFVVDIAYHAPGFSEFFTRITIILFQTGRELAQYGNWYLFWPIALLSGMITVKQRVISQSYECLFFFLFLVMLLEYDTIYLFSYFTTRPTEMPAYLSSSLDRVFLHLSPFVFLLVVFRCVGIFRGTLRQLKFKLFRL